jgi:hypothetical protein
MEWNMKTRKTVLAMVLCLAWLGGITGVALADGVWTWNGGDGNWDSLNWNPPGYVPGNDWNFPYDREIIPNGNVSITTTGAAGTKFSAGLEIGAAANLLAYKSINFRWPAEPRNVTVTNQGSIQLLAEAEHIGLSASDTVVTLTGSGTLVLAGNGGHELGNGGWGGSFINAATHTIHGAGVINTNFTNRGKVTANLGTLRFNGNVDNAGGILEASGSGNVLYLYGGGGVDGGQILPHDGQVLLVGSYLRNTILGPGSVQVAPGDPSGKSTFGANVTVSPGTAISVLGGQTLSFWNGDGGATTLLNHGVITLANAPGTWLSMTNNTVTLSGSGQVVMGGDFNSGLGGGTCTNEVNHGVRGGGQIQCPFINKGTLVADNGLLRLFENFTGTGPVSVTDNATLEITASVQFGNFSMSRLAGWIVWWGGKVVDLKGNFSFAQQDPAKWTFQDSRVGLQMSGGGGAKQSLEVGGRDYGLSETGFTNNFNLPNLLVTGANTYAYLLDAIDNGHRSSREALYVDHLQVDPGATLDLRGLRLYAKREGIIYRVRSGEGALYGGGRIIDTSLGSISATLSLLLFD